MIKELLEKLENLVGTDWFEADSSEIMDSLEAEGAGSGIIGDLLAIMERHPLDDFGCPGAVVHYIERYYPDYIPLLISSLERAPAMHTVWMLNRCINAKDKNSGEYLDILKGIAANEDIAAEIRDFARHFVGFQMKGGISR